MKSKELVEICRSCIDCYECLHEKECWAYRIQFKCYPFHVKEWHKYPADAYSETEIKIPFWLRILYKFIV
jgi:hypothetical protein